MNRDTFVLAVFYCQIFMKRNYTKELFDVLGKWKSHYFGAAVLLFVSTGFRMLEPKILQIAVDGVVLFFLNGADASQIGTDPVGKMIYALLPVLKVENLSRILIGLGVVYFVIAVSRSLLSFTGTAIAANSTEKAIKGLRDRAFAHIQLLPVSFHNNYKSGEMIQRCTGDISTIRSFIMEQVVEVVRLTGIFIASFTMMFLVLPTYAFLAVAFIPVIGITAYLFFKRESAVWEQHEEESDKLTNVVNENLNGIRVVKAFAQEQVEIDKFRKQNEAKLKMGLKHVRLHKFFWPFSDMLIHMQITLSIIAGGYFALKGMITIGELTSFYTYSIMVTWPMRQVGRIVSKMGMATVAMQRLSTVLDEKTEDYGAEALAPETLEGNIAFEDVRFYYPVEGKQDKVLNDVSFSIKAGERVAIIGPAGSGKSTIINLLLRFYDVQSGRITIDGHPIEAYDKAWLRKKIGVVMQQPFLFSTTIEGNIAYATQSYEKPELIAASREAHFDQVIDVFSNGYETMVGEDGISLSGGQKQRVSIARTIMVDPEVLILDDATSAVDTETEFGIQGAVRARFEGKTSIIISHRITSIQGVDKVIVFKDGSISEMGTPKDLLKNKGYYWEMVKVQTALEDEILEEINED